MNQKQHENLSIKTVKSKQVIQQTQTPTQFIPQPNLKQTPSYPSQLTPNLSNLTLKPNQNVSKKRLTSTPNPTSIEQSRPLLNEIDDTELKAQTETNVYNEISSKFSKKLTSPLLKTNQTDPSLTSKPTSPNLNKNGAKTGSASTLGTFRKNYDDTELDRDLDLDYQKSCLPQSPNSTPTANNNAYSRNTNRHEFSINNLSTCGSKKSLPQFLNNLQTQAKRKFEMPNYHQNPPKSNRQAKVYNFLERPTGWKCFIYHFTV